MRRRLFVATISAAAALTASSRATAQPIATAAAPNLTVVSQGIAQGRGTQFVVRSQRAGRDFLVVVTVPVMPPMLPGQKSSAIYALDGGYGLVGASGWLLGGAGSMQAAYIVEIGYPLGGRATREWDLLFKVGTRPDGTVAKGGGGAAFLSFLTEELKPFIESRYPVAPDRGVLFGHSLGGIFTANVLAKHPEAFAGYLIASPSVWAEPDIAARLSASRQKGPTRRVYVAWGGKEAAHMITGGRQVALAVATPSTVFVARRQVFKDAGHLDYYPALPNAAFPFLLPRSPPFLRPDEITVSGEHLRRYEGAYAFPDGSSIRVTRDGGNLFFALGTRTAQRLAAETPERFFLPGMDLHITFEGTNDLPARRLRIVVNGDQASAMRVD